MKVVRAVLKSTAMRHLILSVLISLYALSLPAQSSRGGTKELSGRLVEITDGQTKGVPNVRVSISGNFDHDITDDNGYFKLNFPPDEDFVTVVVENTPQKMIAPPSGLVNVPPDRDVEVVLCGEQNRKLLQQVSALEGRIKKLQKENKLSQRQLLEMHRVLLDTVIFFENSIARLEQQNKETKESLDAEIKARDAYIEILQDSISLLVTALSEALEERFLKQKEYFDQISGELLEYVDKVKDLRDMGMQPRLGYCFLNDQARKEFNRSVEAYESVRNNILRNHRGHVLFVKQYWDNSDPAEQLKETYNYLLEKIHKEGVLPLDQEVFMQIREYVAGKTGRNSAEKEAKRRSEKIVPGLSASILELEKKIRDALNSMSKNI